MEMLCPLLALCGGNPQFLVDSLYLGPVMGSFDVTFCFQPECPFEQIVELLVIWDVMMLMWCLCNAALLCLTYWGRVKHICVSKLTIIGSDNGLSPGRRQAIIWTNAGILLIGLIGTNFSEIWIEINTFSIKKMHFKNVAWKIAAILSQPQCVNFLRPELSDHHHFADVS